MGKPHILIVTQNTTYGAGKFADRLAKGLASNRGIKVTLVDASGLRTREQRESAKQAALTRVAVLFRSLATGFLRRAYRLAVFGYTSFPFLPTGNLKQLDSFRADLIHFHWIGEDTLSVQEIGKIRTPKIWTHHDESLLLGGRHLAGNGERMYRKSALRLEPVFRLIESKLTQIKQFHLRDTKTFISPSKWLGAKSETTYSHVPHEVIPIGINLEFWKPIPRVRAAKLLGIDASRRFLAFGAYGIEKDSNKGFDLVAEALEWVRSFPQAKSQNLDILVFGNKNPLPQIAGFGTVSLGELDDAGIRAVFSISELFVIGSRAENFPQTALESLACGCPFVSFNIGGMPEIVPQAFSQYLAPPYDTKAMGLLISKLVTDDSERGRYSRAGISTVRASFSQELMIERHLDVYRRILKLTDSN